MMNYDINTTEERGVAAANIHAASLSNNIDKYITTFLKGKLSCLLIFLDRKLHPQYVGPDNKGKPVMYMNINKTLYRYIFYFLLFYRNISMELKVMVFHLNMCDLCTNNKEVNGKRFTLVWHVDNLSLSQMKNRGVKNMIQQLEKLYRKY